LYCCHITRSVAELRTARVGIYLLRADIRNGCERGRQYLLIFKVCPDNAVVPLKTGVKSMNVAREVSIPVMARSIKHKINVDEISD